MFINFNSVYDTDCHVLSYLNPLDICRSCQVSKSWNTFLAKDFVWNKYFKLFKLPIGLTLKQHFDTRAVISLNALLKRVEIFLSQVPANYNGKFVCYFPITTKCHISIEILNQHLSRKFEVKETYWFMQTFHISKPVREVFTLNKNIKGYFIHLRLPNSEYFKDTLEKIIGILAAHRKNHSFEAYSYRPSPKAFIKKSG